MKLWFPLAALVLAAACRQASPGDIPKIVFGKDECARCGMIVSEARFASGYVDADGKSVIFDDVGELLKAAAADASLGKAAFVADAENGVWTRAEDAFYANVPGLATPMGTGVAAFGNRASAEAFVHKRGGGPVLDWKAAAH